VDADVNLGNSTEFRLNSAVKTNLLADVLNVPCSCNRSNDGQMEDRAFGIYVRGRKAGVRIFRGSEPPPPDRKMLHGLSPRTNYTDRAAAAFRRSDCQVLRIEGTMWSA
jgi:hypothetical protein